MNKCGVSRNVIEVRFQSCASGGRCRLSRIGQPRGHDVKYREERESPHKKIHHNSQVGLSLPTANEELKAVCVCQPNP